MTNATHGKWRCKHCENSQMMIIQDRIHCAGCNAILGDVDWSSSVERKPLLGAGESK